MLAVTSPGAGLFPLDEELSWLDLSEEERARLRSAAYARDDLMAAYAFEGAGRGGVPAGAREARQDTPAAGRFGRRTEPVS